MAGTAELVNNPSFIGRNCVQYDVTYYKRKMVAGVTDETIVIRKDEAVSWLYIHPDDVPTLIEALQQVYDRRQSEVAATEAK